MHYISYNSIRNNIHNALAIKSPHRIAMEDFLISTSRREAISAPVQAPVPGRGNSHKTAKVQEIHIS